MNIFSEYAYIYNKFYEDKNYDKEASRIDILLKKYNILGNNIIDFGCGTGKHDVELSLLGYKCTGVDISENMIEQAREYAKSKCCDIPFFVNDVKVLNTDNKYDAVISLFHVVSYQKTNNDVIDFFLSARKALDVGGLFIFDVWYGSGVLNDKPQNRIKTVEDNEYKNIRLATAEMKESQNLVDVKYTIFIINKQDNTTKIFDELHTMRYFFRPEMEEYLKLAGFELIDHIDCATLQETDMDSWTCYFIARAI